MNIYVPILTGYANGLPQFQVGKPNCCHGVSYYEIASGCGENYPTDLMTCAKRAERMTLFDPVNTELRREKKAKSM